MQVCYAPLPLDDGQEKTGNGDHHEPPIPNERVKGEARVKRNSEFGEQGAAGEVAAAGIR